MNAIIDSIIPAVADQADGAAFRSLAAALRFAFDVHGTRTASPLARFQPRRGGGPPSLFADAVERAAWAGAIRRRVFELNRTRQAVLIARYAPQAFPCACRRPCCSGWAVNPEWCDALGILTEASIAAVPATLSSRVLRAGVVRRWAGAEKISIGALADRCGVHRNTAGQHAKAITRWLGAVQVAAEDEAHELLAHPVLHDCAKRAGIPH